MAAGDVRKIALIQLNGQPDKARNLDAVERLVAEVCTTEGPEFVALPEMVTAIGTTREARLAAAETFPDGEMYRLLAGLAARFEVTLHGGSLLEAGPDGKCFNTSVVFGPDGGERARYRKLHLFDVTTPSGRVFRESDHFARGDAVVTAPALGTTLGLSICYDVRFPELYQALARRGATVLAVPSAFTVETGRDHWEPLVRARAIETASWVVAATQWGPHGDGGRSSYGHAVVVDPWGHVVARRPEGEGWLVAHLDLARTARVRAQIPVHAHKVL